MTDVSANESIDEPLLTFDRSRAAWAIGVVLLSAIPVVRMARIVSTSGSLPYADYWPMLDEVLRDDGSLSVGRLFTFRNEHPLVFGRLLFWLNARIAAGSNITLGFVVIGVVLAQLGLLAMLARSAWPRYRPLVASFVIASSAALFAPQGVWNFYKSMSGAAWLVANFFAVVALWLASRGRRTGTVVAAIAATVSYGTGIAVWPAVAVCALVVDRRRVPRAELIVGFVVSAVWYLVSSKGAGTPSASLASATRTITELAGSIGPVGARYVGAFVLVSGTVLAVWAVVRSPQRAVWVGLFVYAVGAIALIGRGRVEFIALFGSQSRYASLTSLAWIAWLALSISWLVDWLDPRLTSQSKSATNVISMLGIACAAVLAVGATTGGSRHLDAVHASALGQRRLETALAIGVADGAAGLVAFDELFPPVRDRLVRIGHVPFDDEPGPCDPGAEVGAPQATIVAESVDGFVASTTLPRGAESGFTLPKDAPKFDCIVVVGPHSTVVGLTYEAVASTLLDGHVERSYHAIAMANRGPFDLVMLTSDGRVLDIISP